MSYRGIQLAFSVETIWEALSLNLEIRRVLWDSGPVDELLQGFLQITNALVSPEVSSFGLLTTRKTLTCWGISR